MIVAPFVKSRVLNFASFTHPVINLIEGITNHEAPLALPISTNGPVCTMKTEVAKCSRWVQRNGP